MASNLETPFAISIPDSKIQDLKQKLALAYFPDELEEAGWSYGVPLADMKRLVARWKEGYDWRKHEKELNDELPQFKRVVDIDGFGSMGIHYIHQRSVLTNAIPLLFVHGWPGSFIEVRKILPLLTQKLEPHPCFHVVAFSLPGYAFSDAPSKKGFSLSQYAEVGHKLMLALGYNEYVTQGGDWGYFITRRIASLYGGKHAKAWHSNFERIATDPPTLLGSPLAYIRSKFARPTEAEKKGQDRTLWFTTQGRGYSEAQSTQPQTLGYSLADSPAGLLAWIYEKLVNWTDQYPWSDDEVLTWVSIYWFSTPGPAASARIYYERKNESFTENPPTIPHGVSFFPKELVILPRSSTRTPYTIFEAEHDSGGHFAAYEKPEELVTDLRNMFGKGGPAYGVVKGSSGYDAETMQSRL